MKIFLRHSINDHCIRDNWRSSPINQNYKVMASIVATWSFGIHAVRVGEDLLSRGETAQDACEGAIAHVEDDPDLGLYFVGRGGAPNGEGVLQCDAAIMDGQRHSFGAVAAIEGIATPIRVARKVMDNSRHNFLVVKGAQDFAISEGFQLEPNESLIGQFKKPKEEACKSQAQHDTLGVIVRDQEEHLAVGVSTSGLSFKSPGRVGDSPLPGGGLYVDDAVGGACTTGDGDQILRFCPSYRAVGLMERGLSPQQAACTVVRDIVARMPGGEMFEMGIITMDKQGRCGAAGSVVEYTDPRTLVTYPGFPYAVWSEEYQLHASVHTGPVVAAGDK